MYDLISTNTSVGEINKASLTRESEVGNLVIEKDLGEKMRKFFTGLDEAKMRSLRKFVSREMEWGETVRSKFVDKEMLRQERVLSALDEVQLQRLQQFVSREVEWGETVRSKFVDKKMQREQEYSRALEAFLEWNRADLRRLAERAVTDELAVREAASGFLDAELSKLFPVMDVCADGLSCGRNGGLDLLEAVCAYQYALGLDAVLVRPAHCESVCPRDGGVAVKCPDSKARVCSAPESDAFVRAAAAAVYPTPLEATVLSNPNSDGLNGVWSGLFGSISGQSQRKDATTTRAQAASVLIEVSTDSLNEAGTALAAKLSSLLLPEDFGRVMDELNNADDDERNGTGESAVVPESGQRGDFSQRSSRVSKSWSVVAARLVALECQQQRFPLTSEFVVAGPGVVRSRDTQVGVPLELVLAHRAKHFGDEHAARKEWARAVALYSYAIDHAPPKVLEPAMPNEKEVFQAAELAKGDWAGSIWFETGREQQNGEGGPSSDSGEEELGTSSVLTIPTLEYLEAFFSGGGYGIGGSGRVEGTLQSLSIKAGGILEGSWSEMIPVESGGATFNGILQGPEEGEGGAISKTRKGRFRLKMNPAGHAFLGERFDENGDSLGLWHGYRLQASAPLASPPPIGITWIHGALVERARASLELYFEDSRSRRVQGSHGGGWDDKRREQTVAGLLASAVADCETSVAMWPRDPEALVVLAVAKEAQRDLMGAIQVLEEVLFLQPPPPADTRDPTALEALRARSPDAAAAAVAAANALVEVSQSSYEWDRESEAIDVLEMRVLRRQEWLASLWALAARRDSEAEDGDKEAKEGWRAEWEDRMGGHWLACC